MNSADFTAMTRDAGFTEILERSLPASPAPGEPHTHEFDARLLILDGAFTLTRDGVSTTHGPGEVFSVMAGTVHAETIGPEGARYVVARRYPTGLKS